MAKLVVNLPNRPKGANVSIPGLGTFENGKEHEVDSKTKQRYERRVGKMPSLVGRPLPAPPEPPKQQEVTDA